MNGVLNIFKPLGVTSSGVVLKLKKMLGTRAVGHFGTLDPMASGVLPIGVGKSTRLFDYFLAKRKVYVTEFTFGKTTDTLDSEGQVIATSDVIPTGQQIVDALPNLSGVINQVPPQYSAKNVGGVRAYALARAGQEVELKPKQVEIFKFDYLAGVDQFTHRFEIECSSGTYIRSLARDLGQLLNTVCYMSALERTIVSMFKIDNAYTLESLEQHITDFGLESLQDKLLIEPQRCIDLPSYTVLKTDRTKILNGQKYYSENFPKGSFKLFLERELENEREFFGIATSINSASGNALKIITNLH
ncbi:MAG: tRNA pseudouridine(55) synthase TruB [Firmicutes bacterium]|nr:tRNA pseudouridine(55) synthase TruB [Bacillota bacterium]